MSGQIQKFDGGAVSTAPLPKTNVEALIAEILPAIRGGTDPAIVDRQIALFERLMAMKAKENFDGAMERFRGAVPPVLKTKSVENMYRYAPLDAVVLQVREALQAQGFTWSFDQRTDGVPTGHVCGVCIASMGGHSERREVTLPVATGNRASDATKAAAGALSFAQRRAFQNAFGIVVQGDDTDANLGASVPGWAKGSAQADPLKAAKAKLWALLQQVGPGESPDQLTGWMQANGIIERKATLASLDAAGLAEASNRVEAWLEVNGKCSNE